MYSWYGSGREALNKTKNQHFKLLIINKFSGRSERRKFSAFLSSVQCVCKDKKVLGVVVEKTWESIPNFSTIQPCNNFLPLLNKHFYYEYFSIYNCTQVTRNMKTFLFSQCRLLFTFLPFAFRISFKIAKFFFFYSPRILFFCKCGCRVVLCVI